MSEIRVDSFKAEDGIGAPSFPNGIQVTGVVTATVLDATVPFLTVGSNAQLGNAGIVTATGIDINGNADVSGNLSVGGVLTYEDVKNVDAIGIVTARSGIKVTGGQLDVGSNIQLGNAGVATATTFVGALTGTASNASGATGDFSIADKIIHTGDTDTAIRFSAADTVSIETAGNEQVKFNHSTGTVLYNHIVPNNDSTKDIGTNTVRFRNIYADNLYGDGTNITGISGGGGTDVGITTNLSGSFSATPGSPSTINTFSGYSSDDLVVEYTIYIKNGSNIQTQKLLAMRDGTTIDSTQFAVMFSSSLLAQFDATISSGNILLRATPESGITGNTDFKVKREVM